MTKLYKQVDGRLRYHEAWVNEGVLYEHWGPVGERGKTTAHHCRADENPEEAIARVLAVARQSGFHPIELEEHTTLIIEYEINAWGTTKDLDKRHALQKHMDETLGWRGLGACDGGSIGSGTMEVFCLVVDYEIARSVVVRDLRWSRFRDYSRIFRDEEPD